MLVELKGRSIHKTVPTQIGKTLLDLALQHKVDWNFSCNRGTCARCRCLVTEGGQRLSEPSDAELDWLDDEELDMGYRLGCQCRIREEGPIQAVLKSNF
ncbi:2Fe-2S iron-sulfur cluster-binding protein [Paenibacillus sp. y28]|uniref:2Fe-2S iron-sulfur cluster-binding protein n=1 Tax=Paenibacillus sp. y28 TaxID=3129110 RepID=UPI00301A4FBB